MTARAAFIGFPSFTSHKHAVEDAFREQGVGEVDVLIETETDVTVAINNAIPFLLVSQEDGTARAAADQLFLYFHESVPAEITGKVEATLTGYPVSVTPEWSAFDAERAQMPGATASWLAEGEWPPAERGFTLPAPEMIEAVPATDAAPAAVPQFDTQSAPAITPTDNTAVMAQLGFPSGAPAAAPAPDATPEAPDATAAGFSPLKAFLGKNASVLQPVPPVVEVPVAQPVPPTVEAQHAPVAAAAPPAVEAPVAAPIVETQPAAPVVAPPVVEAPLAPPVVEAQPAPVEPPVVRAPVEQAPSTFLREPSAVSAASVLPPWTTEPSGQPIAAPVVESEPNEVPAPDEGSADARVQDAGKSTAQADPAADAATQTAADPMMSVVAAPASTSMPLPVLSAPPLLTIEADGTVGAVRVPDATSPLTNTAPPADVHDKEDPVGEGDREAPTASVDAAAQSVWFLPPVAAAPVVPAAPSFEALLAGEQHSGAPAANEALPVPRFDVFASAAPVAAAAPRVASTPEVAVQPPLAEQVPTSPRFPSPSFAEPRATRHGIATPPSAAAPLPPVGASEGVEQSNMAAALPPTAFATEQPRQTSMPSVTPGGPSSDGLVSPIWAQPSPEMPTISPLVSPVDLVQPEPARASAAREVEWGETRLGECIYVSASHGGAGKTTFAYLIAYLIRGALLRESKDREVYLVETDFENPKLWERFDMRRGQDSSHFAEYLANMRQGGSGIAQATRDMLERTALEESTYEGPGGLQIIAAPYDVTNRRNEETRYAIERIVSLLLARGAVVVLDAHTLGGAEDNLLDKNLAPRSQQIVIMTDAPVYDDRGQPKGGHISDARRIIKALHTPAPAGGFGVPKANVSVVLNRTTEDQMRGVIDRGDLTGTRLSGRIDSIPAIEKGWIGQMDSGAEANALLIQAARVLTTISPREDVARWLDEMVQMSEPEPEPEKRRGIIGRLLNR